MKIAIAYFTKTGNNKDASEKLASLLNEKKVEAGVYSLTDDWSNETEADIYVFSSPTRAGSPPGKVKKAIDQLQAKSGAAYAIMNTCMAEGSSRVPAVLGALAEKKGLKKAADGLQLPLKGLKGPISEVYLEKLNNFTDELVKFKPS